MTRWVNRRGNSIYGRKRFRLPPLSSDRCRGTHNRGRLSVEFSRRLRKNASRCGQRYLYRYIAPRPRRYVTVRRRRRRDCCAREVRQPSAKIESRRRHRRRELGDTASVRSRRSPRYRRLRPASTSLRELHVRECFAIIFLRVSREFFAAIARTGCLPSLS